MEKRCSGECRQVKSIEQFYKRKRSPDGYAYKCKECTTKYVKEYKKKHPEKQREYVERYRKKDIKKYRKKQAEWMLAKRRAQGAKPNSRSKGDDRFFGKRLKADPFADFIREYSQSTGIGAKRLSLLTGVHHNLLEKFLRNSRQEKTVTEDIVDRVLIGIDQQYRFNELYPVN